MSNYVEEADEFSVSICKGTLNWETFQGMASRKERFQTFLTSLVPDGALSHLPGVDGDSENVIFIMAFSA